MKHKYFDLYQPTDDAAVLTIYGDITSFPWEDNDVSAYNLSRQLGELSADHLDVFINSYGGEVAEGLAIYNALKRNPASVTTYCDGFAASIASVIFMAGDERIMNDSSLLFVHKPSTFAAGNAKDFRKAADDLDTMESAIVKAYQNCVNIDEAALTDLLDHETWITSDDAVSMGFATGTEIEAPEEETFSASARDDVMRTVACGHSFNVGVEAGTYEPADPELHRFIENSLQNACYEIKQMIAEINKPHEATEKTTLFTNFQKENKQ